MSDDEKKENTETVSEENNNNTSKNTEEDPELEEIKKKYADLEEEDEKLRKMQEELEGNTNESSNKGDVDSRSIYVGQVDYATTPEELQQHFSSCGTINRVTILCDKWTGQPKGFAYIEFAEADSVSNALLLNETLFKGRQLKVSAKRTNLPGMSRGKSNRGRAPQIPPVSFNPYAPYLPAFPMPRGFGVRGGGRGRGRGGSGNFY